MTDMTPWRGERLTPPSNPSDRIVGFRARAKQMSAAFQYKSDVERALTDAGLSSTSTAPMSGEQLREYNKITQSERGAQERLALMFSDQNALLRSVGLPVKDERLNELNEEDQIERKRILQLDMAGRQREHETISMRNFLLEDEGLPKYHEIKLGKHTMDDQKRSNADRIISLNRETLGIYCRNIRNEQKELLADEGIAMGKISVDDMPEHKKEIYKEIICMNRNERSERFQEIKEERNILLRKAGIPEIGQVQLSTLSSSKRREFFRIQRLNKYQRGEELYPSDDE